MSLRSEGPRGEVDAEIRHHVQELEDLLVSQGWTADAARAEAERRFGDTARIRREIMAVHARGRFGTWVRSLGSDLRHAIRGLKNRPVFTASVVGTLALGLGAAASIFAVVDALVLRPLPYRDQARWMVVNQAMDDGGYYFGLTSERFQAWREALGGVSDAWIGYAPATIVRTDGPDPEQLTALTVTPGADRLLGIPLRMGRGFTADDARPGAPAVAVLSRAYWERLGADPGILGRSLHTEVGTATVVGVLRGGVRFPPSGPSPDLWLPIRTDFTWAERPRLSGVGGAWAHLAPGVTPDLAQARADAVGKGLAEAQPSDRIWRVHFGRIAEHRGNPDVMQALWTLSATVAAILLIALVNGTNLTLIRASSRAREVAVRLAIGGSRRRLLRHFTVEGIVLGLLSGAAALLLGRAALAFLRGILPESLVWFSPHRFVVESRTTALVAGAAFLSGLVLGVLPALRSIRASAPALALAGRGPDDRPSARRFRNVLVGLQVALTTTLLVVAGLLTHSMSKLLAEDPGFDVAHIAEGVVIPSSTRYSTAADRWAFVQRMKERLVARPEVEAVAVLSGTAIAFDVTLRAEGEEAPADQPAIVPFSVADADYLAATGAELLAGRGLTDGDVGTDHVLVDQDLARFLWPGASALGRRFRLDDDRPWMTVVGVLRELRLEGRDQRKGPYQFLRAASPDKGGQYVEFLMRTRGDPETLLPAFRATLREVDPDQWTYKLETGAASLADSEGTPRFLLLVMGLLAAIATALSAVGLYGVLSYSVACRRRELGIRMALGADRGRVRSRVLGEGLLVALVGVGMGVAGALALSGMLARLLYRLQPIDPVTYLAVPVLLLGVAGLAAALPARRATRVDPLEALRSE